MLAFSCKTHTDLRIPVESSVLIVYVFELLLYEKPCKLGLDFKSNQLGAILASSSWICVEQTIHNTCIPRFEVVASILWLSPAQRLLLPVPDTKTRETHEFTGK